MYDNNKPKKKKYFGRFNTPVEACGKEGKCFHLNFCNSRQETFPGPGNSFVSGCHSVY
jgi:hypothetical protein